MSYSTDTPGIIAPLHQIPRRASTEQASAAPRNVRRSFGSKKYMTLIRHVTRSQLSPSPFWKTYVGSSFWKRRRDEGRHAASLQTFNAELCGFYQLPVELVLQIVQLLPVLDKFCLRMTSRRFAMIIKRTDVQTKTDTDIRVSLDSRLSRDRFTRRADLEVITTHSPEQLLCWPCRTSHPRHYFDSTEIHVSGRVRRCQGYMCLLQICPHVYLTRWEVLARVARVANMAPIDCPIPFRSGGCPYRPAWIKECKTYLPDSRGPLLQIMLGQSLLYKSLGARRIFYRSDLVDMLKGLTAKICPHMSTHDEDFLRRFAEMPASRMYGSKRIQEAHAEKIFGKENDLMAIRVPCQVEDCDTYLKVEKLAHEGAMNLHFTVSRSLGRMDEPLDTKWLVQCGVWRT